jgi:integrase
MDITADIVGRTGKTADEIVSLAAQMNTTFDAVVAFLTRDEAPLVRTAIDSYLATLNPNTRRTYSTPLWRLRDGCPPVCDQMCPPCMEPRPRRFEQVGPLAPDEQGFTCRCSCAACLASRITIPACGDQPVSAKVFNRQVVENLAAVAERRAQKQAVIDNRARAGKKLAPKATSGSGARETAIGAARALFEKNLEHTGGVNAAAPIRKGKRRGNSRYSMDDFELIELAHLTATGGDDPELDLLLLEFGVATGARREGPLALEIQWLNRTTQMIAVADKYATRVEMPVSAELIDALIAHAISRGGERCDPASANYDPHAPVFYYRNGTPLTSRRFDTLAARWQKNLEWARDHRVTYHCLRHTMATKLDKLGSNTKRRYLRHAPANPTEGYGECTEAVFAKRMSALLEFEHPMVHGVHERRCEVMTRLGLAS